MVYNSESMLTIEVEIQSLRILVETKVLEKDWMKERYEQLALIDEKRVIAQYHAKGYQKRIARAFNKKMKPGWSGPFIIKKIMSRSVTRITDLDGEEMFCPISMDRLQRYNI